MASGIDTYEDAGDRLVDFSHCLSPAIVFGSGPGIDPASWRAVKAWTLCPHDSLARSACKLLSMPYRETRSSPWFVDLSV